MDRPDLAATSSLTRASDGDPLAAEALVPLVQEELRRIAERQMARERLGHTLQPTALVNEVYLRLIDQTRVRWNDRAHFMAIAAQTIRRILVDHARRHGAAKRGGGQRVAVDMAAEVAAPAADVDLLVLEEALERLSALNPRQARIVDLRFFGGLGVEETAVVLGVSPRTVKGEWRFARAWLERELGSGAGA